MWPFLFEKGASALKLIVGLGNPGAQYLMTRHNIGFIFGDALAQAYSAGPYKTEHKAHTAKVRIGNETVLLAKPQTYMNRSGESVQALLSYYDVGLEDMIVAHDDIEIPFASMLFQSNRGHGGNNGIRDIHAKLGTKAYDRLRLGVGRPSHPAMDVADYVLQNFSKDEQPQLTEWLDECIDAIEVYLSNGLQKAATNFNRSAKRKSK